MIARVVIALIVVAGVASAERKQPPQKQPKCVRVHAPKVAARDLVVIGVVAKGTQHKLLLMDKMRKQGYIVQPGDCVGSERVPFDRLPRPSPNDGGKPLPIAIR